MKKMREILVVLLLLQLHAACQTESFSPLTTTKGHQGLFRCLVYSKDGSVIASAGDQGEIDIWKTGDWKHKRTLPAGRGSLIKDIVFTPDNRFLVTCNDGYIKIWNVNAARIIKTILASHHELFYRVSISPDGKYLAAGNSKGYMEIFKVSNWSFVRNIGSMVKGPVTSQSFSADGKYLVFCRFKEAAVIWRFDEGAVNKKISVGYEPQQLSISPTGNLIALGGGYRTSSINLYQLNSGKFEKSIYNANVEVTSLAFSPDGNYLAVLEGRNKLSVFNIANSSCIMSTYLAGRVKSICYSPDGNFFAYCGSNKTVSFWRVSKEATQPPAAPTKPSIVWKSPKKNQETDQSYFVVRVGIVGGDKVEKANLYVNDKLVSERVVAVEDDSGSFKYFISTIAFLPQLENIIRFDCVVNGITLTESREVRKKIDTVPIPNTGQKRLALVVGNSIYDAYSLNNLRNAANDADSMEKVLQSLRFDVIKVKNAGLEALTDSIESFAIRLHDYNVGLLFYAGHAAEIDGRNYLMPVDMPKKIDKSSDLADKSISVSWLSQKMSDAGGIGHTNIIILDACRENPFELKRSFSDETWAMPYGMPTGTITAFATSQGRAASDGYATNGLYTSVLLKYIRVKGIEIEELFKWVRIELMQKYGQVPVEVSELTTDFYFNP